MSSGVKNLHQGEVKSWIKEGDATGDISGRNLQERVISSGSERKQVEMPLCGVAE